MTQEDHALFVDNLERKVTEELLFELFHQAGPVIKVTMPRDKEGKPKQFALVNFKHAVSVPFARDLLNGIKLFGRPIRIKLTSGTRRAWPEGSPSCGRALTGHPSPPFASSPSRYARTAGGPSPSALMFQSSSPPPERFQRQQVMSGVLSQGSYGGRCSRVLSQGSYGRRCSSPRRNQSGFFPSVPSRLHNHSCKRPSSFQRPAAPQRKVRPDPHPYLAGRLKWSGAVLQP